MANYKSIYTGAEIDSAIGKANTALQEHQDISGKVDKVQGKQLSTNDFTNEEKTKLAGIDMSSKQDTLVSGTNIKTINNTSILGSGNIDIEGGGEGLSSVAHNNTLTGAGTNANPLGVDSSKFQSPLVSGTNIKTINNKSILGSGNITIEGGENTTEQKGNYIHISFDDVSLSTSNLGSNDYESIYEEPFFAFLKDLHDTYGAKFSLYLFDISNLSNIPTKFKDELTAAKDWLKFGLHWRTGGGGSYTNDTYQQGATDWNFVVNNVVRFGGTAELIDRVPRLNLFGGSKAALSGMRDADCGALGFLAADDNRVSYFLNTDQATYLRTHDVVLDVDTGLYIFRTDMRGDWFENGFTPAYEYDAPTQDNVYDELALRYKTPKYVDSCKSYIWFCHEWKIYDGTTMNNKKQWVIDACRFASDYDIPFDYPQNRLGLPMTSLQFTEESLSVKVESVELNTDRELLLIDDYVPVTATITPSNATQQAISWSSSNENVQLLPMGNGCMVKGITAGNSVVSCTTVDGSFSDSCNIITINAPVPCTGITLNNNTLSFTTRNSQTLVPTLTPSDTTDLVSWSSSDTNVAIVDENGVVTPRSVTNQTCTITATCGEQSATCEVSVNIESVVGTVGRQIVNQGTQQVNVLNDILDVDFYAGYASASGSVTADANRATSYNVLSVAEGDVLHLHQNIEGLSLQYAVFQGKKTAAGNLTASSSNAYKYSTGDVTIGAETTMAVITFKHGSGTTPFTQEQADLLNTCVTVTYN